MFAGFLLHFGILILHFRALVRPRQLILGGGADGGCGSHKPQVFLHSCGCFLHLTDCFFLQFLIVSTHGGGLLGGGGGGDGDGGGGDGDGGGGDGDGGGCGGPSQYR